MNINKNRVKQQGRGKDNLGVCQPDVTRVLM